MSPIIAARGPLRDERGAVAVEFGLLALPFFTLIYAILEISLVFFAGQILDSAVQDASRKIRTGQAQTGTEEAPAWDLARFRTEICAGLYSMFDCSGGDSGRLRVNVTVVNTFSSAVITSAVGEDCQPSGNDEDCEWTVEEIFTPGLGSDIVVIQAFYKWPTIVNLPGLNMSTQVAGNRLLTAARVFRNEPF